MIVKYDHIRVLSQNKILKGDLSVQDREMRIVTAKLQTFFGCANESPKDSKN